MDWGVRLPVPLLFCTMKILNDNSYLKVWTDGHSPILFVQLKPDFFGLVNALEVYTMMNIKAMRSLATTHKELYLLLDLGEAGSQEIGNLVHSIERTLIERLKATFRFISVVGSKGQGSLSLNHRTQTAVGVSATFFEGLSAINDMRVKEYVLN